MIDVKQEKLRAIQIGWLELEKRPQTMPIMTGKQQNLGASLGLATTTCKPRQLASEFAKQTLISLLVFVLLIGSSQFPSGDVSDSRGRRHLHVGAISFQPQQAGTASQAVASGVVNGGRQSKPLGGNNSGGTNGGATSLEPTIPPQLSSREVEKAIVDRILGDGYDKRIRPAGSTPFNASKPGTDGPTIVRVNTLVRSISKIDDVTMEYSVQLSLRQEWTDDRLAFGTMRQYKDYGLNSITLTEQERIWKPDLFFRNEKEGHFHKIIMPNVLLRIRPEGQVLYSIRISLVLACPMDLKYYPLDKQNCTIEMASYGYLDEDLKFTWKEVNPVQMAKPLYLPRFTLENFETAYCTSRTTTGAYSCLRIDLIFKREFSYYLIQIYIPCCMLVIVSWVSFWLDPNAIPARVSLGVTTLLTMATQISGINASLPPVSYTKAIDVWTGVCLTFVFGALLEFALVNYASRSDQHKREMLNSALTQTQQMRWREATAAAAAAGVAPPTSPPPDENSPSHLASKHAQSMFFGPSAFGPLAAAGTLGPMGAITGPYHAHHPQPPALTTVPPHYVAKPNGVQTLPNLSAGKTRGPGAQGGIAVLGGKRAAGQQQQQQQQQANSTITNQIGGLGGHHPMQTSATTNNNNGGGGGVQTTQMNNNCQQHPGHLAAAKMTPPQINRALQYLRNPREILMEAPAGPPKRKNWCKMWLAKFPTRSKRIDVISRIFFPLKFALFNLVYWTTYLFREEDTTQ